MLVRSQFEAQLAAEVSSNGRGTLLLVDVDQVSWANNEIGFAQCDLCLERIAAIVAACATGCLLGRLGGERFAVLAREGRDAHGIAETIRAAVEVDAQLTVARRSISRERSLDRCSLTASIGLASPREGDTASTLIQAADAAVRLCKGAGGNCVRERAA